jgi:hypothetical protein
VSRLNPGAFRHRLFAWVTRLAGRARGGVPLMAAFMLGVFTNALSDPGVRNVWDALRRVYEFDDRPIAWVSVAATATIVLLPTGVFLLRRWARTDRFVVRVAALYERRITPELRPFAAGRIAWGSSLVLQSCPNLESGWKPSEVEISRRPTTFAFPSEEEDDGFLAWKDERERAGVDLTGTKYMVVADPSAFLDAPRLRLSVQECTYAQARFYAHHRSAVPEVRQGAVAQVMDRVITFPHSVALHATVATVDDHVLFTRRSAKVDYFPGRWSCSIEEQLSPADFPTGGNSSPDVMGLWAARMLREELGLGGGHVSAENVRVSAVFLEADILSCALAALVTVGIDRATLDAIIRRHPREDYEFVDWHFLHWSQVPRELLRPTLDHHPTSGLRMFLGGVMRFGAREFGVRLDREERRLRRGQVGARSKQTDSAEPA